MDSKTACGEHGEQRPYIVCRHVALNNEPAYYVQRPDADCNIGVVVCFDCDDVHETNPTQFVNVCEQCCQNKGWIDAPTTH